MFVAVGVREGVRVTVGVLVSVGVCVTVGVFVGVGVRVAVGVMLAVALGVKDGSRQIGSESPYSIGLPQRGVWLSHHHGRTSPAQRRRQDRAG